MISTYNEKQLEYEKFGGIKINGRDKIWSRKSEREKYIEFWGEITKRI